MLSGYIVTFRQYARRLWVRAALISLLAILAAFLAPLSNFLPFSFKAEIDRETLQSLLDILTNTMLTVATFSLSIMVTAHLATDGTATPRAYRLLQQDSRTQTVIATFLGAFIYALTLKIILHLGWIAETELAIIYILTVAVIGLVVIAILRWVGHLDGLGSVEATMRRADERAKQALDEHTKWPFLGAREALPVVPAGASPLRAPESGYIQNIATSALSNVAGKHGVTVHLMHRPGAWVAATEALAYTVGPVLDDAATAELLEDFLIADRREHGQDTIFSLLVLTEIGERALSPGINDPRTGVYTISRLTRLIAGLKTEKEGDDPVAPNVYIPALDLAEVVATTLDPLVRDGRTFFEVCHATQTAARDLAAHDDPTLSHAARTLSARGLAYARDGIFLVDDLRRIGKAAIAKGPAATTVKEQHESAVEALGEEDNASFFRETS